MADRSWTSGPGSDEPQTQGWSVDPPHQEHHGITESWNWFRLEGTFKPISFQPLPGQGCSCSGSAMNPELLKPSKGSAPKPEPGKTRFHVEYQNTPALGGRARAPCLLQPVATRRRERFFRDPAVPVGIQRIPAPGSCCGWLSGAGAVRARLPRCV